MLTTVRITNYRALKDLEISLSGFSCIIGENNAGKSSLLLALNLFLTGSKLPPSEYYDPNKPVVVECVLENITEDDLDRLVEEHRTRISGILVDGALHLVRIWDPSGKSELKCRRLVPKEPRFHRENVDELLKGKTGRELERVVRTRFPELAEHQFERINQKAIKEAIESLIESMPRAEKVLDIDDLPTGIDVSIKRLLPEPVYIPAVREIADEMKTKESATFGRIVGVLLSLVRDSKELQEIEQSVGNLRRLLNRVVDEATGQVVDERIPQLRELEASLSQTLQEHFPNVTLEIEVPPPDVKTILSESQILVDDGTKASIESKGDGLKRAVVFALLRTYVTMRARHQGNTPSQPYLILFEEPELYLHPRGQRILFDALVSIASDHQVVVTTHSPLFFGPNETGTFIRMEKARPDDGSKPYAVARPIHLLKDLTLRDAFQVICFENNAAAFFANKVLLVEGDSDRIFLSHVAKVLREDWNFDRCNIAIIPVGGKGSIKRYHQFFSAFSIPIHVLADLDVVIDGFKLLPVPRDSFAHQIRDQLIKAIDEAAAISTEEEVLSGRQIREILARRTVRERYQRVKELALKIRNREQLADDELDEFTFLLEEEVKHHRRRVLENSGAQFEDQILELVRELATHGVHVLLRGSIEAYYPAGCAGDKLTCAIQACAKIRTWQDAAALWPRLRFDPNGEEKLEFEFLFEHIFSSDAPSRGHCE